MKIETKYDIRDNAYFLVHAFSNHGTADIFEAQIAFTLTEAKSKLKAMKTRLVSSRPIKFNGIYPDDCEEELIMFEIVRVVNEVAEEDACVQTDWFYVDR